MSFGKLEKSEFSGMKLNHEQKTLLKPIQTIKKFPLQTYLQPPIISKVQYGVKKRGQNNGGREAIENSRGKRIRPKLNCVPCVSGDGTIDLFYFDEPRMRTASFLRYLNKF